MVSFVSKITKLYVMCKKKTLTTVQDSVNLNATLTTMAVTSDIVPIAMDTAGKTLVFSSKPLDLHINGSTSKAERRRKLPVMIHVIASVHQVQPKDTIPSYQPDGRFMPKMPATAPMRAKHTPTTLMTMSANKSLFRRSSRDSSNSSSRSSSYTPNTGKLEV